MIEFLWMVLGNLGVLCASHALLKKVATGKPAVDATLFLLLRIGLISALVMVAGLAGALCAEVLGVMGAGLAAIVLARRPEEPLAWTPPRTGRVLAIAGAAVALKLLVQVWVFAPSNYDVLSYHLLKVAEWIRAEGFTREMGLDSHVSLPAGFELVETWWVAFLRHDALIEMAGVEYVLLGAAGAYGLAQHLGLSDRSSAIAGLGYALTPGIQIQATSCLNDGATAALLVATLLLIVERAPIGLLLFAGGLGIGTKPTFAYALPGLFLLALLSRREGPPAGRSPRTLPFALAAGALLVGGFWYVRNAVWYGNPIHPVGLHGLSDTMGKIQMGMDLGSLGRSLRDLLDERLYDRHERLGALLTGSAGWGAFAFACGTVALLGGLREDARLRRLALASAVSFAFILLLSRHDPWNMRFVLFFPAILSVAAARLCERAPGLVPVAGLALFVNFAASLLPGDLSPADLRTLWAQGVRARSLEPAVFGEVPPSDTLGCFFDVRRKPYPLYRPDFSRRLVYVRARSAGELLDRLRDEKVPYVFAHPHHPEGREILEECIRLGRLRRWRGQFFEVTGP